MAHATAPRGRACCIDQVDPDDVGHSRAMRGQIPQRQTADARCACVAAKQYGVITLEEARAAGMSDDAIHRRLRKGEWRRVHPKVFVISSAPATWEQELLAASRWAGEDWVASHRSAAALWDFDGFACGSIELTGMRYPPSRRHGITMRRTNVLDLPDRTELRGIPLTRPTRTLIDLGQVVGKDRVEEALESALRRGLTAVPYIRRQIQRIGVRGRHGAALLLELLNERGEVPPTDSRFETLLDQVLREVRLPLPQRQFKVFDPKGLFVAQCDFAYPGARVAIEGHSFEYHAIKARWDKDAVKHNRLTALGWKVLYVTWNELRNAPERFIAQLRIALGLTLPGLSDI